MPALFFDMPFRDEVARDARTAVGDLVKEARKFEGRRVPQAYEREDGEGGGSDLVPDLLREIEDNRASREPRVWFVVAPAGQGKSISFCSLFAQLYQLFQEKKKGYLVFPRPLPMLPAHIREAAGKNVMGIIDAFLRSDIGTPSTRRLFEWMVDNRYGLWMLDGLDEVITRDEKFFPYLEERITSPGASPSIVICVRDSLFQSCEELSDFLDYYSTIIRVFRLKPWDRSHLRMFAWIELEGKMPQDGDTPRVGQFLDAINKHPAAAKLASLPFYADVMLRAFRELGALGFKDEVGLLDLAVTEMCRREYGKGVLREDLLPLHAFREWLEALAVVSYESGGVSIPDLRDLASFLPALVTRPIGEEEEEAIVEQIVMAPLLTRSATSGRVEFTHEILGEYLAGRSFLAEFKADSPRFASRLSQRPWPPDSILLRVLSQSLANRVEQITSLAIRESLPADGFRNLVQLLAMTQGGDAVLRTGRLMLDGARLAGVHFHQLNLDDASLRGCDLSNADFTGSFLRKARFEGSLLKNTRFTNLPEGALMGARFGGGEHFDSIIVGERRRIEDRHAFHEWVSKVTGQPEVAPGPCPSSLQLLHLFRKFVHVNGQGRRDWIDRRGLERGRRVPGAPLYEDCISAALSFRYLEKGEFAVIRRPTGSYYGEMVSFVKNQVISSGIRSLLDSLCRVPGCVHISRAV